MSGVQTLACLVVLLIPVQSTPDTFEEIQSKLSMFKTALDGTKSSGGFAPATLKGMLASLFVLETAAKLGSVSSETALEAGLVLATPVLAELGTCGPVLASVAALFAEAAKSTHAPTVSPALKQLQAEILQQTRLFYFQDETKLQLKLVGFAMENIADEIIKWQDGVTRESLKASESNIDKQRMVVFGQQLLGETNETALNLFSKHGAIHFQLDFVMLHMSLLLHLATSDQNSKNIYWDYVGRRAREYSAWLGDSWERFLKQKATCLWQFDEFQFSNQLGPTTWRLWSSCVYLDDPVQNADRKYLDKKIFVDQVPTNYTFYNCLSRPISVLLPTLALVPIKMVGHWADRVVSYTGCRDSGFLAATFGKQLVDRIDFCSVPDRVPGCWNFFRDEPDLLISCRERSDGAFVIYPTEELDRTPAKERICTKRSVAAFQEAYDRQNVPFKQDLDAVQSALRLFGQFDRTNQSMEGAQELIDAFLSAFGHKTPHGDVSWSWILTGIVVYTLIIMLVDVVRRPFSQGVNDLEVPFLSTDD